MSSEAAALLVEPAVLSHPIPKLAQYTSSGPLSSPHGACTLSCQVKLFDFGGMDKRHLPFREIEPEEGNVVVSISYSGTGHAFLACTAGSQPKVGSFNLELPRTFGYCCVHSVRRLSCSLVRLLTFVRVLHSRPCVVVNQSYSRNILLSGRSASCFGRFLCLFRVSFQSSSVLSSCHGPCAACFLQVYDRDGNQLCHFVKGDPYLKVSRGGCICVPPPG